MALDAAAVPFRLEGAVVVGGFSEAWHLLICLDSKSLREHQLELKNAEPP